MLPDGWQHLIHQLSCLKIYWLSLLMTDTCAWCDAPKTYDSVCPSCGADYAKAEAIKRHGSAKRVIESEVRENKLNTQQASISNQNPPPPLIKDPVSEWYNCLFALPAMLLGAWLCQVFNVFDSLQRIVFGMPVHEVGHAFTAWLSGFNAIPTLWFTRVSPEQGIFAPLLLFGLYFAVLRYAFKHRQYFLCLPVGVLFFVQMYATFGINNATAEMMIVWGGDGMGLVIASVMMCSFYLGKETQMYKGSVRWGILFWGAAAFMDIFMAWWEGQSNISRVGYGKTGHGLTDAYRLINEYVWSWEGMFASYLYTAYACLLMLVVVYTLGLLQARGWKRAKEKADRLERRRLAKLMKQAT